MAHTQNAISNTTISAFTFWERWRSAEDMPNEIAERFENVEDFLLRSRPPDLPSCAMLLSLVIDSMRSGGRSDLKDVELLEHVQSVIHPQTAIVEDSITISTITDSVSLPPIKIATR